MINFDMNAVSIKESMGISDCDIKRAIEILVDSKDKTLIWTIRRIWIDETISDAMRCFLIFRLGMLWSIFNQSQGESENAPWWK